MFGLGPIHFNYNLKSSVFEENVLTNVLPGPMTFFKVVQALQLVKDGWKCNFLSVGLYEQWNLDLNKTLILTTLQPHIGITGCI